jgi:hypothetical protein
MTLFTVDHLHGPLAVPGFLAVPCKPIFIVGGESCLLRDIPVTGGALHFGSLVRGMGEINVVRLPGIHFPWNGLVLLYILFHQDALVLGAAHW